MRKKDSEEMRHLLNLNYTRLTNRCKRPGPLGIPELVCGGQVTPDYIALCDEPGSFSKTLRTAVGFYRYDVAFDGHDGLFSAIYYDLQDRLDDFRERFKGVRLFIEPDNSQCGDVEPVENHQRVFRARVVSLWLHFELGAVVIPNLTYWDPDEVDLVLDGLTESRALAVSTKGALEDSGEASRLLRALKRAFERMPRLETLVVYTTSPDDEKTRALLAPIVPRGVKIAIPENALRVSHRRGRERRLADGQGR